jgi:hypothetical protein
LTDGLTIVTLVTDREKNRLASRAAVPTHDTDTSVEHREKDKLSRKEAARKLTSLAERNMERKGLSEEEKNRKVGRFAAFVDGLKKSRRKP